MTVRLLLVRHGESVVNVTMLASDNWEDNPLTALGRAQVETLVRELRTDPVRGAAAGEIVHVYTSGMERARQTGQVLAAGLTGSSWSVEPGLHEIEVGIHEGERGQAAAERAVRDFTVWFADGDLSHGYLKGETGFDTAARVSDALRRIARRHDGQTVVVVSHGCALAMALTVLCDNLPLTSLHGRLLVNCGLVEVAVELGDEGADDETWTCIHWQGDDPAPAAVNATGRRPALPRPDGSPRPRALRRR